MGKLAEAFVDVGVNLRPMETGLGRAKAQLSDFASKPAAVALSTGSLKGLMGPAGMGLGAAASIAAAGTAAAAGVGLALFTAAKKAADLGESISKVKVTFGSAAGAMIGQSDQLAARFGVVKRESLDAAAAFGLMGIAAGQTKGQAAAMGQEFVQLGIDLASYHNISNEEAFEKLRAGLAGEAEPLRPLGIMLSEDAMKAEALAQGIIKVKRELTEAEKVAARASLIKKQAGPAIGDRARTDDSGTNQLKTLQGNVENFVTDFGTKLQGALGDGIKLVQELGDGFQKLAGKDFASAFGENLQAVINAARSAGGLPDPVRIAKTLGVPLTPGEEDALKQREAEASAKATGKPLEAAAPTQEEKDRNLLKSHGDDVEKSKAQFGDRSLAAALAKSFATRAAEATKLAGETAAEASTKAENAKTVEAIAPGSPEAAKARQAAIDAALAAANAKVKDQAINAPGVQLRNQVAIANLAHAELTPEANRTVGQRAQLDHGRAALAENDSREIGEKDRQRQLEERAAARGPRGFLGTIGRTIAGQAAAVGGLFGNRAQREASAEQLRRGNVLGVGPFGRRVDPAAAEKLEAQRAAAKEKSANARLAVDARQGDVDRLDAERKNVESEEKKLAARGPRVDPDERQRVGQLRATFDDRRTKADERLVASQDDLRKSQEEERKVNESSPKEGADSPAGRLLQAGLALGARLVDVAKEGPERQQKAGEKKLDQDKAAREKTRGKGQSQVFLDSEDSARDMVMRALEGGDPLPEQKKIEDEADQKARDELQKTADQQKDYLSDIAENIARLVSRANEPNRVIPR